MRRALVLVSVVAAGLLGTGAASHGPADAAAPRAAAKPSYTIENLYINRRVGDFFVSVTGGTDQEMTGVTISRGNESAYYGTKDWQLDGKELTVHFGDVGYLHMTFQGAPDLGRYCGDRADIDGTFKGQFRFRGEGGYLSFDLHSAPGQLGEVRDPCPPAGRRRPVTRRAAPKAAPAATLIAHTSGPLPSDRVIAAGTHAGHGKFTGAMSVLHYERRGSLMIGRDTVARVGRDGFRWDFGRGTATVHPEAPLSGRLTYSRGNGGAPGELAGSLRAPMLGVAPIVIDGADLVGHLERGVQSDE